MLLASGDHGRQKAGEKAQRQSPAGMRGRDLQEFV